MPAVVEADELGCVASSVMHSAHIVMQKEEASKGCSGPMVDPASHSQVSLSSVHQHCFCCVDFVVMTSGCSMSTGFPTGLGRAGRRSRDLDGLQNPKEGGLSERGKNEGRRSISGRRLTAPAILALSSSMGSQR